jgi:hypothetical protein
MPRYGAALRPDFTSPVTLPPARSPRRSMRLRLKMKPPVRRNGPSGLKSRKVLTLESLSLPS